MKSSFIISVVCLLSGAAFHCHSFPVGFEGFRSDGTGCWMNGTFFYHSETLPQPPGDPCSYCLCDRQTDHPVCAVNRCADPGCVDYEIIGSCCPSCPNGRNCEISGQIIREGDHVTRPARVEHHLQHCEETCTCMERGIFGTTVSCYTTCTARSCRIHDEVVLEGQNSTRILEYSNSMDFLCRETCMCMADGGVSCHRSCTIQDVQNEMPMESEPDPDETFEDEITATEMEEPPTIPE